MRWLGVWLLPLLLAGCAAAPSGDSPEAVCQRQAYENPAVKAQMIKNQSSSTMNPSDFFALDQALHTATDTCLRQKGVAVRGGVQAVQPGW
jgi:hypothetical protein